MPKLTRVIFKACNISFTCVFEEELGKFWLFGCEGHCSVYKVGLQLHTFRVEHRKEAYLVISCLAGKYKTWMKINQKSQIY
jgi:hypothetical protein